MSLTVAALAPAVAAEREPVSKSVGKLTVAHALATKAMPDRRLLKPRLSVWPPTQFGGSAHPRP